MSDAPNQDLPEPDQTAGQRLDAALAALNAAFEDLRTDVEDGAEAVSNRIKGKVAEVSAKIDDVRAAWGHDEADADA